MKKELLLASALVGTVGLSGVAQAASADFSWSGHTRNGVTWNDTDAAGDALMSGHQQSSLSLSLSSTTDNNTKISTGFDITNENDEDTDSSGLTFTFNNGIKLDVIEAGSAYASHLASVPSAAGEQGIASTTIMAAPTGLDYASQNDLVGFELHSGENFLTVEGLKAGVSASFNGDAAATTSAHAAENSFSVGASYVTTVGDNTNVTVGGGFFTSDTVATAATSDTQSTAFSIAVAPGDALTVGVGYASGAYLKGNGVVDEQVTGASITTAGISYALDGFTFNLGFASGEGTDSRLGVAADGSSDAYEQTAASVGYTIASGVSATIGYSDRSRSTENLATPTNSGTSWYIGADVSF